MHSVEWKLSYSNVRVSKFSWPPEGQELSVNRAQVTSHETQNSRHCNYNINIQKYRLESAKKELCPWWNENMATGCCCSCCCCWSCSCCVLSYILMRSSASFPNSGQASSYVVAGNVLFAEGFSLVWPLLGFLLACIPNFVMFPFAFLIDINSSGRLSVSIQIWHISLGFLRWTD